MVIFDNEKHFYLIGLSDRVVDIMHVGTQGLVWDKTTGHREL